MCICTCLGSNIAALLPARSSLQVQPAYQRSGQHAMITPATTEAIRSRAASSLAAAAALSAASAAAACCCMRLPSCSHASTVRRTIYACHCRKHEHEPEVVFAAATLSNYKMGGEALAKLHDCQSRPRPLGCWQSSSSITMSINPSVTTSHASRPRGAYQEQRLVLLVPLLLSLCQLAPDEGGASAVLLPALHLLRLHPTAACTPQRQAGHVWPSVQPATRPGLLCLRFSRSWCPCSCAKKPA